MQFTTGCTPPSVGHIFAVVKFIFDVFVLGVHFQLQFDGHHYGPWLLLMSACGNVLV